MKIEVLLGGFKAVFAANRKPRPAKTPQPPGDNPSLGTTLGVKTAQLLKRWPTLLFIFAVWTSVAALFAWGATRSAMKVFYTTRSGDGEGAVLHIALALIFGLATLLLIGLPLIIDELRATFRAIAAMLVITAIAGFAFYWLSPLTDGNQVLGRMLGGMITLGALAGVLSLLGQRDIGRWVAIAALLLGLSMAVVAAVQAFTASRESKDAQTDSTSVTRPVEKYPCSFFIEGTTYSARILGPGRFEVVSERRRSNAQFVLVTTDMGTWEQTYPKDCGAFEFTDPNFTTQTINGFSWSSSNSDIKRPISLSCPNLSTLIPSS